VPRLLWPFDQRMRSALLCLWRGLTDGERLTWNTGNINYPALNKFGDAYTPSGYQVFMTLNLQMNTPGTVFNRTCPLPQSVPDCPFMSIDGISEDELTTTLAAAVPEGFKMAISSINPIQVGKMPAMSSFKLITYVFNMDGAAFNLAASYQTVFGLFLTLCHHERY